MEKRKEKHMASTPELTDFPSVYRGYGKRCRIRRDDLKVRGRFPVSEKSTPWQEIFQSETGRLNEIMVLSA